MSRNQTIADQLQAGKTVSYRPKGNSMTLIVRSGQHVTVEPCTVMDVAIGDVVFCRVRGNYYLHLVKGLQHSEGKNKPTRRKVLVGNNHGHDNGWTDKVYGKLTQVEP